MVLDTQEVRSPDSRASSSKLQDQLSQAQASPLSLPPIKPKGGILALPPSEPKIDESAAQNSM